MKYHSVHILKEISKQKNYKKVPKSQIKKQILK